MIRILYKVDIGFDPERGYAAVILDPSDRKQKGVKGNSIRQLCRNLHEAICEDDQRKRRFPLESDGRSAPVIVTPDSGDPLFKGV